AALQGVSDSVRRAPLDRAALCGTQPAAGGTGEESGALAVEQFGLRSGRSASGVSAPRTGAAAEELVGIRSRAVDGGGAGAGAAQRPSRHAVWGSKVGGARRAAIGAGSEPAAARPGAGRCRKVECALCS